MSDPKTEYDLFNTIYDDTAKAIAVKMVGGVAPSGAPSGAVTIADGDDVALGKTTDAALTTDVNGTLSGKLRGLVKILGNVWDSGNSRLNVAVQNAVAVTGTFWQATQPVSVADAANVTQGAKADAAWDGVAGSATMVSLLKAIWTKLSAEIATVTVSNWPATQPVSVADAANVTQGAKADAAWDGSAGSPTIVAILKAIWTKLGSVAVTGTFWQATQPISAVVPTNSTSAAYETNRLAKASAGTLFGLTGYNSNAAAQFIQVHDAGSLPADTAVPKVLIKVNGASAFAIDFGLRGRAFATGIVACNSSTGPTKTIGAADCWFDVQYS